VRAKKSTALAGAPEIETSFYNPYENPAQFQAVDVQGVASNYAPYFGGDVAPVPEQAAVAASMPGGFTQIGVRDTSRPVGPKVRLPGELGKFVGGEIERHEYALALRGDKGAGKSRFQYQLLNLFAALGFNCGLFTLEIDKNSGVIEKYRDRYIAPANRARVQATSACDGIKSIREAAKVFDVIAVDSWGKIPNVAATDFDKLRKDFPATMFIVIFQSTSGGTARGGPSVEYDASAVCQVNLPGVAVFEKNRYADGAADEFQWDVNTQKLIGPAGA